jgi:AcrR family transcriptional regulator
MSTADAPRTDRRKVRTRAALIAAGQQLIREGRDTTASIQTITDLADVGFGSFYNHFATKDELFDAAVAAAMTDYLAWLDERLPENADPVQRLFESVRLTGRLATEAPLTAAVLARRFTHTGERNDALGERMRDDVRSAMSAANPTLTSNQVRILSLGALGAMQTVLSATPTLTAEQTAEAGDILARGVLRLLSLDPGSLDPG